MKFLNIDIYHHIAIHNIMLLYIIMLRSTNNYFKYDAI